MALGSLAPVPKWKPTLSWEPKGPPPPGLVSSGACSDYLMEPHTYLVYLLSSSVQVGVP